MTFPLTKEQRRAVDTLDVNCIVTAGAGSGKTRVLVERYLKIIEEESNFNPNIFEEIIAITFTEKAAKEMKERVRESMLEKKNSALNNNQIDQALVWRENIQKLERATISTIHSFCSKILREYPIEADLDPEFIVMESADSTWILADVIKKELKKALENEKEKDTQYLYQWVKSVGFKRAVSEIIKIYNKIGNTGLPMYEIAELTEKSFDITPYQLLVDLKQIDWIEFFSAGDKLNNCESSTGKKLKLYQESWPYIKEEIHNNKLENNEKLEESLNRLVDVTKGNFGAKVSEDRKVINELAKKYLNFIEAAKHQNDENEIISSLASILVNIDSGFSEEKAKQNALDFDDLQLKTIKLLQFNQEIREKIHNNISYLMLDEFQDSNQIQKKLVSLLLEDENKFIEPGSLFVVGDPKQSIYRFRGADVSLFKEMELEILESSGRVCPLRNNFRSSSTIIDFINYFFSQIMSKDTSSPNYYEIAIAGKEDNDNNDEKVEFIPIYHEKGDEQAVRDKEATLIAKRIRDLINEGVRPEEMAILFRSMSHVKKYEQELTKFNIPFYVVGGRGFYQKQEIYDLLNILEYLLDSENKIALTGILRSPLVAINDDTLYQFNKANISNQPFIKWKDNIESIPEAEKNKLLHFNEWFEIIKSKSGRVKVNKLLDELILLTNYESILLAQPNGIQAVANIEKFIRLVNEYTEENQYSIYEFLKKINRLMSEEQQETEAAIEAENGDTVKIMTIHKSKGLQFPYVFIPDLSRESKKDDSLLKFDSKLGLTCRVADSDDEIVKPIRWILTSDKEKILDREESVRVLYVAMTRPIKKLILSGKIEYTKGKFAKSEILLTDSWSKWFDIIMQYESISLDKNTWTYRANDDYLGELDIYCTDQDNCEDAGSFGNDKNITELINSNKSSITNQDSVLDYTGKISKKNQDTKHSISAIKRYLRCPRYYYFIDRLSMYDLLEWLPKEEIYAYEEDIVESDIYQNKIADISPTLKGTIIHQMIEEFTKKPETLTEWDSILDTLLIDNGLSKNNNNDKELILFKTEIKQMIDNFSKSQFYQKVYTNNVKTEYDFILQFKNGIINGIIDRLEFNNDETYTVTDYKSNKDISKDEYTPQILTYALAVNRILNLKPTNGILYFLRYNKIEEIEIDEKILDEWESNLEGLLLKINQSETIEDFPKNNDNCDKCIFRKICCE